MVRTWTLVLLGGNLNEAGDFVIPASDAEAIIARDGATEHNDGTRRWFDGESPNGAPYTLTPNTQDW